MRNNNFNFSLILYLILSIHSFCLVLGQAGPFDEIRESDPRVKEIRQELAAGTVREDFRLRYGGTRGDYLTFYDRINDEIYFRYREDRFDTRSAKRIRNLIEGEPYRAFGTFSGVILADIWYPRSHPDFVKLINDPQSIPVFDYIRAESLRLEEMLM